MRHDRLAIYVTVAVVVALSLATGPSVGLITVPEGGMGANDQIGEGAANVSVLNAPDRAELVAGSYGDVHYLTVPEVPISARNVTGSPLLTVSIDIEELGYSRSSIFLLRSSGDERRTVEIERASLDSTRLEKDVYQGRYQLVLRDDSGRTVIFDEPIVIEVTG